MIALQVFDGNGQPFTRETTTPVPGIGVMQHIHMDGLLNPYFGMRVRLQIQAHEMTDWCLGSAYLESMNGETLGMAPVFFRDGETADSHPTGITHHKVPKVERRPNGRVELVAWEQWHVTYRGIGR